MLWAYLSNDLVPQLKADSDLATAEYLLVTNPERTLVVWILIGSPPVAGTSDDRAV
jgi:hypothetical protein